MIGEFKNANKSSVNSTTPPGDPATDGFTTIYTAPTAKASYIIELDVASKGTSGVQVSARVRDASLASTAYIVKQAPVPIGSSLQIIDGQKIVLEEGDSLEVKCETVGENVDVICSLVENVNS